VGRLLTGGPDGVVLAGEQYIHSINGRPCSNEREQR
jgi:hypothetical protein